MTIDLKQLLTKIYELFPVGKYADQRHYVFINKAGNIELRIWLRCTEYKSCVENDHYKTMTVTLSDRDTDVDQIIDDITLKYKDSSQI